MNASFRKRSNEMGWSWQTRGNTTLRHACCMHGGGRYPQLCHTIARCEGSVISTNLTLRAHPVWRVLHTAMGVLARPKGMQPMRIPRMCTPGLMAQRATKPHPACHLRTQRSEDPYTDHARGGVRRCGCTPQGHATHAHTAHVHTTGLMAQRATKPLSVCHHEMPWCHDPRDGSAPRHGISGSIA